MRGYNQPQAAYRIYVSAAIECGDGDQVPTLRIDRDSGVRAP